MKQLLTGIAVCLAAATLVAQRGGAGLDERFKWEAQTPWGSQRADQIAQALADMSKNPPDIAAIKVEPFKIFDNVYYVGIRPVSSFLVTTNAGLVLIDTTLPGTADLVMDNIRALGFDPANIKYILITHSHSDHFGGAGRIKEISHASVVSSDADWKAIEQQQSSGRGNTGVPLKRDVVKATGDTLKVGDQTFTFYVQPGHTPGALASSFQVFDRGRAYKAFSPGGLGMQFTQEWTEPFIKGIEQVKAAGPYDVVLTDHPFMMIKPLAEIRAELAKRGNGQGPNPAVSGPKAVNDWFDGILKIAYARRAAGA